MNNKIIILAISFFLLISFVYLSLTEKRQADINTKNVWMTYFENPKDSSLDFTIENHSSNTEFHWQILSDKDVIKNGDAVISNGKTQKISANIPDTANKKIIITVSTGEEKKEIYKSL